MKNNWIRFLAGALVSVMLVGAFALTGGMKGGKSTEGLLYQASGLHPDGEMLVVDGQIVTCEEYLYWVDYVCTYLASQLPDVDWNAAVSEGGITYGDYVKLEAVNAAKRFAVTRAWAEQAGIALTDGDMAALALQRQELVSLYGEEGYQQQLDAGKRQMYKQGLISSPNLSNDQLVTEAKAALRKMKLQLLQGQLQLTTGTASAYTQFDAAQKQLEEGWAEYNAGQTQLEESRTEYESRKAEAEQKLADGLAQLNDAEEQVSQIKKGEWYVLDRTSTMSCVTFAQYADRMDAIARVFPVFFFLVAALVATTTMTRMVDENRLQMGTLKALGYSNTSIAGKYLLYGIAASVLGSIVGIAVGFVVFPTIFWYAYRTMMFSIPTFTLHFYPGLALGSMALSAAVIGLATLQACRASLKEKSAALLLPRAPAAGKRILLEYLTPLWKRMSFSQKTTARNLFRYKKRFFMTVLGVAGCTALLLIGFGIQDSLLPMLTKQTTELTHADLTISLSDEKALTMEQGLADTLDSSSAVRSWGAFYTKSTTLYNEEGGSADVSIVGAEDDARMTEYFTFRTRQGHKAIAFDDSSVILTEKTAEKLGLSVGDSFEVETTDGGRRSLTLTGITENYVFTRLYLSQAQLKTLNGGALPAWNAVYGQTDCPTDTARASLSSAILACNYVSSVSFHRGHHSDVRWPDRLPELCGHAGHRLRRRIGRRGALQPHQRQPGRAQKGACHHQGAGLL